MTRFRDAKVCNNLATDEIDDHRIQSDFMNCNIQKERTLHLVLRLRGETEHDTNDNVTAKTQSTFHTAHMNIDTWSECARLISCTSSYLEGSGNTAYFAWKEMDPLDVSYLLTSYEPKNYDLMET